MAAILLPLLSLTTAAAKLLQSCPTLCDPIDGSPPVSALPRIPQARTLEWAAISFCSAWKWKVKVKLFSRVWLFATPWTAAHQARLPMGFSRQEYWSGLPLPLLSLTKWALISLILCPPLSRLGRDAGGWPISRGRAKSKAEQQGGVWSKRIIGAHSCSGRCNGLHSCNKLETVNFGGNCELWNQEQAGVRPDLSRSWHYSTHRRPRDLLRTIGGFSE